MYPFNFFCFQLSCTTLKLLCNRSCSALSWTTLSWKPNREGFILFPSFSAHAGSAIKTVSSKNTLKCGEMYFTTMINHLFKKNKKTKKILLEIWPLCKNHKPQNWLTFFLRINLFLERSVPLGKKGKGGHFKSSP